jgi:hypothetical protein
MPDDVGNEKKTPAERPKDTSNPTPQGVRFASGVEEIEPTEKVHDMTTTDNDRSKSEDLSPEAKEEIRSLAMTLQKSKLQESRMSNFQFEPVSLPASRVRSSSTVKASSSQDVLLLCSKLDYGCKPGVVASCGHIMFKYLDSVQAFADGRR